MAFEHKYSTRHPIYWVIAVVATPFGGLFALGFGVLIIVDGFEWGPLLALIVGLAFVGAGLFTGYRIIFPQEFATIISKEMITCKTNGKITYQVNKEDIKMVSISGMDNDKVCVEMKNNENNTVPVAGFVELSTFLEELKMHGYPVD